MTKLSIYFISSLISFFTVVCDGYAQNLFSNEYTAEGPAHDDCLVAVSPDAVYLVSNTFLSQDGARIQLMKINYSGQLIWAKELDLYTVTGMAVKIFDSTIVLSGHSNSHAWQAVFDTSGTPVKISELALLGARFVDLFGSDSTYVMAGTGQFSTISEILLARYSGSGELVAANRTRVSFRTVNIRSVCGAPDGEIQIVGEISGANSENNMLLCRFYPDFSVKWIRRTQTPPYVYYNAKNVITGNDGTFLICGSVNNGTLESPVMHVLTKFNNNGVILWCRKYNDITIETVIASSGGYLIYATTMDGTNRAVLMKVDENGHPVEAHRYEIQMINTFDHAPIVPFNNGYLAGSNVPNEVYYKPIIFAVDSMLNSTTCPDTVITITDSTYSWTTTLINDVITQSEISANEISGNVDIISVTTEEHCPQTVFTGKSEYLSTVTSYPNPVGNTLTVDPGQNSSANGNLNIRIMDLTGRQLNVFVSEADGKIHIDVSALGHGIYFLELHINNKIYSQKFIKAEQTSW